MLKNYSKRIIIRADGNAKIGAGHIMRCLTIAKTLPREWKVLFLCADSDSAELAEEWGFEAYVLHTDYREMEQELPVWKQLFSEGDPKNTTLLVDSYFVTEDYLKEIGRYGKLVWLDDMAEQVMPVDVVVNYNVFAGCEDYRQLYKGSKTKCCVGSRFVPLRQEFRSTKYDIKMQAVDILITTGGGDSENIGGRILQKIRREDCRYHLVTGKFNPYYDSLKRISEEKNNVFVYHDVKNMAELMSKCDLAVTAGGTTIYELCAIGVPFVCFSYARNQERLTEFIGKEKIAAYAGAFHKEQEETLERIACLVNDLLENQKMREKFWEVERQLVDGLGASRIGELF